MNSSPEFDQKREKGMDTAPSKPLETGARADRKTAQDARFSVPRPSEQETTSHALERPVRALTKQREAYFLTREKAGAVQPSVQKHAAEIGPAPVQGAVSGGGYTVAYLYNLSRDGALVPLTLQIPDGVAVVVTPLTNLAEGTDYRVQNGGGSRARSLVVSVRRDLKVPARIQVTMTRGISSYVVVFQFPVGTAMS